MKQLLPNCLSHCCQSHCHHRLHFHLQVQALETVILQRCHLIEPILMRNMKKMRKSESVIADNNPFSRNEQVKILTLTRYMHTGKYFHFSTSISNIFHQMHIFFADINILASEIISHKELNEMLMIKCEIFSMTYRNKLSDMRSVSTA